MTFKATTYGVVAASALFLAGCETGTMMETDAAVGGKTFAQMQDQYPDITAVEFSVLDDNNDGVIDATEEMDIGDDEDQIEVSDS